MVIKQKLIKVDEEVWIGFKEYCKQKNLKITLVVNDIIEKFLKEKGEL